MKRFFSIALAVLLLLAVAGGFTALALRPPEAADARRARLADLAEAGVTKGDWPGVAWAEVAPGRIVALGAAGFADIAAARPMRPDTIMPVASITKVIVGLAGAVAIHQGALDPDAPLSDYLSLDIAWPDDAPRSFTHLATHTSGLRDSDAGYAAQAYHFGSTTHPMALKDFLAAYLTQGGAFYDASENFAPEAPGRRYAYSNIGAGLAAQAISDATGEDFASYAADVLAPLGLSGGWGHLGPPGDGAATLYARGEAGAFDALPPYGLATWPDGQYTASARDLGKLLATVMGGGVFDGAPLLAPDVVELLTAPRVTGRDGLATQDDMVGLFWSEKARPFGIWRPRLAGHSGGDPGVLTMMFRKAGTDTGFVLLLNGAPESLRGRIRLARIVNLLATMPRDD